MIIADTNIISYLLLPTGPLLYFGKAMQIQDTAESIIIQNEFDVSSSQVLALAHHFDMKLVTQDKKILKKFPSTAISVADFLSQS